MDISADSLKKLLERAFDAGYESSGDLKAEVVEEIVADWQRQSQEKYRVYSVEELKRMPNGAIFRHATKGRGWIATNGSGKHMHFQTGETVMFTQTGDPWDKPMQLLHVDETA